MFTHVLVLALSLVSCWGKPSGQAMLPTPNLSLEIISFEAPSFAVNWDPVVADDKNPIAGFKVKVWKSEKQITFRNEYHDGVGEVVVKEVKYIFDSVHTIPKTKPIVKVVGPKDTEARFETMKNDEEYQIRVQAFNDAGDEGPYSNAVSIKFGKTSSI